MVGRHPAKGSPLASHSSCRFPSRRVSTKPGALQPVETGELAEALIADTIARHGINHAQLTLHADRGTSMTSKPVAQLVVDLGVARSHSRPM